MSISSNAFVSEYRPAGAAISTGVSINGTLFVNGQMIVPYPSGFIVQAADGTYWQFGINVVDGEGVVTTTQVFL